MIINCQFQKFKLLLLNVKCKIRMNYYCLKCNKMGQNIKNNDNAPFKELLTISFV